MRRRLVAPACALSVLVTACQSPPASTAAPSSPPEASMKQDEDPPARRPTRSYVLRRSGADCEVLWIDVDDAGAPTPARCPPDLDPGERLRLVGKTCVRETADPERRTLVVCPDPLTDLDRRDRAALHREAHPVR